MNRVLKEDAEIEKWYWVFPDRELLQAGLLALDEVFPNLPAASPVRILYARQQITAGYDTGAHALAGPDLARLAGEFPAGGRIQARIAGGDLLTLQLLPAETVPSAAQLSGLIHRTLPASQSPASDFLNLAVPSDDEQLLVTFARGDRHSLDAFEVHTQALELGLSPGFETLLSLTQARELTPYEHQQQAVRRVLRWSRGRSLLCDEVGLGKTIEAGLILLELVLRKLARRVLILTPPSLCLQWREEMRRKFGLNFEVQGSEEFRQQGPEAWQHYERVICSFHTAKRAVHRRLILEAGWDLIIIDEAHHLRNRETMLWKFASHLRSPYFLMLTATPVQNDLSELFNLIHLLRPGHLETAKRFEQNYVTRRDRLRPKNVEQLRSLLAEVMIRNRRSSTEIALTRRHAVTLSLRLSPDEQKLYSGLSAYLKRAIGLNADTKPEQDETFSKENGDIPASGLNRMSLMLLQTELGSSPAALVPTLRKLAGRLPSHREPLLKFCRQAEAIDRTSKLERLLALLREGTPDGEFSGAEKLLVFSRFKETQAWLARHLREAGVETALFHGTLRRQEKEAAVRSFEEKARVLISTESGGEGRNLQFCRALLNFDLPWNPMRIEQRIGRLSRIGQQQEVLIFNFSAARTIEAAILDLLDAKINLFELVVGEVGMILGKIAEDRAFEDIVLDHWLASGDDIEFHGRLESFGDQLAAARQEYKKNVEYEEQLFGDRFQSITEKEGDETV